MIPDNLYQSTPMVSESSLKSVNTGVSLGNNIKYPSRDDNDLDHHTALESLETGGNTMASSSFAASSTAVDETGVSHQRWYGRRSERSTLSETYRRWNQSWWKTSQCCLISGPTGVGKTALWQSLQLRTVDGNTTSASAGVAALRVSASPLEERELPSLAVGLIHDLGNQVAQNEELHALLHRQTLELSDPFLRHELGLGSLLLREKRNETQARRRSDVPKNLSSASLSAEDSLSLSSQALSNAKLEALQSVVRSVLQDLADHRLLVVVLEDLHWASRAQLDFLGASLPRRVFVVATLRENRKADEVEEQGANNSMFETNHQTGLTVETAMEGIKQFCTAVEHWPLGPLPRECIANLVRDRFLGLTPEDADVLTQYLSEESQGNWQALEDHLKMLQEYGALHEKPLSVASNRSSWQVCRSLLPGASVVTMEEACHNKIQNLPQQIRNVLTVAAVIGSRSINLNHLALMIDDRATLYPSIRRATAERLIIVDDSGTRFANHLVHRTLYSQIPEDERAALHLQVGGRIWSEHRDDDDDEVLMLVVRHLMQGEEALASYADQISVCRLYQKAGHVMMKSRDVSLAALSFRRAIALIHAHGWKDQYPLFLDLHNHLAEASFCVSDRVELARHYHLICQHARCVRDTCSVTAMQIHAWAGQALYDQAWELGTSILSKVGERCVIRSRLTVPSWRMQVILRRRSNESIRRLPVMEDPRAQALMHVLASLAVVAFAAKPQHLLVLSIRMLQLTLKYGLSKQSGIAFATYGIHLARSGKNMAEAERIGKLALALCKCDSLGSILSAIPVMGYYGFICPWMEPFSNLHVTVQSSFQKTLRVRDMNTAALYSVVNTWSHFESTSLTVAAQDFQSYIERVRFNFQSSSLLWHLPRWKLICTLMGCRIELTSNEIAMLQKKPAQGPIQWSFNLCSLISEYLLGDITSAAQRLPLSAKKCLAGGMDTAAASLFESLTLLAQYRTNPQRALIQSVKGRIQQMRKWAKECPHLFSGRLALVEAEFASVRRDDTLAAAKYQLAIAKAQETQLLLQEALANERATFHFWDRNDIEQARSFGDEAFRLYQHWGAFHKAEMLRRELVVLDC